MKVQIFYDESCEMLKIDVNNECVFEGNYWDFHHRDIALILKACKIKTEFKEYSYDK